MRKKLDDYFNNRGFSSESFGREVRENKKGEREIKIHSYIIRKGDREFYLEDKIIGRPDLTLWDKDQEMILADGKSQKELIEGMEAIFKKEGLIDDDQENR